MLLHLTFRYATIYTSMMTNFEWLLWFIHRGRNSDHHPNPNSSTFIKDPFLMSVSSLTEWKSVNANASPPSPTEPEVGIMTLMQRMKTLSEQTQECTPIELTKRFENVESQSAELTAVGIEPQETPADISIFVDDSAFTYQDFAKRGEHDISSHRVQDYSWSDHGYSLVNRLVLWTFF